MPGVNPYGDGTNQEPVYSTPVRPAQPSEAASQHDHKPKDEQKQHSQPKQAAAQKKKKEPNPKVKERFEKQAMSRPKQVIEMEARAKLRQQKREELQQIYEEKKRIQEEERLQKQKEEEMAALQKMADEKEQRRQAKMEEMRQKEEARREREQELGRIQAAREYFELSLLRKYILGTFQKLIALKRQRISRADNHHIKWIKKHGLQKLKTGIEIQKFEQKQEMDKKEKTACTFHEFNTKVKVLQLLVENKKYQILNGVFHQR